MQLDKVVSYHKALADPTRIRMLILLAEGELNGQVLAAKLGVTPATVTHHATKLRVAGLIQERRDKNTIYFTLNHEWIKTGSTATEQLIYRNRGASLQREEEETMENNHQWMEASVLKNFFTADGRIKSIPVQLKKKLIVLEHLASKLDKGRKYPEKELNEFIKQYHEDFATIRREMIMHQYMYRENQIYELNPQELWTKWRELA
jgi:hypothetical protein